MNEKSLRQLISKGCFSKRKFSVAQKDLTLFLDFYLFRTVNSYFYYSIKRILQCVEFSLQACHTLQKIIGYIPYKSFSSWPNRKESAFICLASRQTEMGIKFQNSCRKKGSLTFSFCFSASPLSVCPPNIQTGVLYQQLKSYQRTTK